MTQTNFRHLEQIFRPHNAIFLTKTLYFFENLLWNQVFLAFENKDFIVFSFSDKLYREIILIAVTIDMNLVSLSRIFCFESRNLLTVKYHVCFSEWVIEFHIFQKVGIWYNTTWAKICLEFLSSFTRKFLRDFFVNFVDSLISKACPCVVTRLAQHFSIERTVVVVISYFESLLVLSFYSNGLFNYIMS